jgi:hypothetical protein
VCFSQRCRVHCTHSEFEMLLIDRHSLQNCSINFFSFNINNIHLLSDTLKSRFCAKCSNVRSYETMSLFSDSLEIDIFVKLHIFCVNSKDLESADFIRDTNIDFSIKSSESS